MLRILQALWWIHSHFSVPTHTLKCSQVSYPNCGFHLPPWAPRTKPKALNASCFIANPSLVDAFSLGWKCPGVEFYHHPEVLRSFSFSPKNSLLESQYPGRLIAKWYLKTWKYLPVWRSSLIAIWGSATKCIEGGNYSFGSLAVKENPNPGAFLWGTPMTFYSLNKSFLPLLRCKIDILRSIMPLLCKVGRLRIG